MPAHQYSLIDSEREPWVSFCSRDLCILTNAFLGEHDDQRKKAYSIGNEFIGHMLSLFANSKDKEFSRADVFEAARPAMEQCPNAGLNATIISRVGDNVHIYSCGRASVVSIHDKAAKVVTPSNTLYQDYLNTTT